MGPRGTTASDFNAGKNNFSFDFTKKYFLVKTWKENVLFSLYFLGWLFGGQSVQSWSDNSNLD